MSDPLDKLYQKIFKEAIDYMEDYEVQAVAATYMAIAMRLYKTHLDDDEYKSMIQTVIENLDFEAAYIFLIRKSHIEEYNGKLPVKGMHGYNSDYMNMHAIFYAYGSRFKENYKIKTFELIHIYPLLCELLGVDPHGNIDGDLKILKSILK